MFLAVVCYACSPTRYIGKDEFLLNRVKVAVDGMDANVSALKKTVRQRPNTRILGVARFHLGIYNMSGANGEKVLNKWLRSIGEPPVVYSPFLTSRSIAQLELYLSNKGYYNAVVSDTVWFKKKKAYVEYRIDPGALTRVKQFTFQEDSNSMQSDNQDYLAVHQLVENDTLHTLLKDEMPLDIDVLEHERERVSKMLRSNGYYNFSKDLIQYYADTLQIDAALEANLMMTITNSLPDSMAYRKYKINKIRINLDYNPLLAATGGDSVYQRYPYGDYEVVYNGEMKIKPNVILESVQFIKGDQYNVNKVATSYARLQALNLFKFVNIVFKENVDDPDSPLLDCEIQLTPMKRQSYNVFLEGTNNSGNIGIGGNFSYNHKNLFKGGENLTLSVWGALKKETLKENEIFSTTELGTELKFVTPQFWVPIFRLSDFRRNNAPKTSISLSYSEERTQFYHRQVASAKFGYLWRKEKWHYDFDLVDLNYVLMPFVDEGFINDLKNLYVKSAYTDHLILSANLSAVYTDQESSMSGNFNYFRGNLETSGNVLQGFDKLFSKSKASSVEERYYEVLGVRYAQFIKADGEYRFNYDINRANSLISRVFVGLGYPYGNMKVLPFEESYFCGGANDLRAWHSRTLGPGSYAPLAEDEQFPNSVGDFKLAANLEYRFKLFWLLEGAMFLDAGNVWNINKYENRPGAQLTHDFYKQIAVGTGLGLRLNVNFFLLRLDLGIKMHDPSMAQGRRFVLFNRNGGFKESVLNIAIGYPF